MIKGTPNYKKLRNDYIKEMSKISKAKKDSNKSVNKLLAPPKKLFIRKVNKVKGKTEKHKTNKKFIKNRNEKKSNTFKPYKSINLDLIDSSKNKINKISPKTNKTDDFLKEDNRNFFSYFLDNINYSIFK